MELIGLDIGTSHIKAVSVSHDKKFFLTTYAIAPAANILQAIQSESSDALKSSAKILSEFFVSNNFQATQAVITLPDSKVFTKLITMPKIEGKDFDNAVTWEAEQHLPHKVEDVYLRYSIISEQQPETLAKKIKTTPLFGESKSDADGQKEQTVQVLLVAAPKNFVNRYVEILNIAGVEPVGVETTSIASARAVQTSPNAPDTALIDFGYSTVTFSYVSGQVVRFVRTINIGLANIIKPLMQELDFSAEQASEYLFTYGLKENELDGKIRGIILPTLAVLSSELQKSIDFIEKKGSTEVPSSTTSSQKLIKQVILAGGGALIPNILPYFAQEMSLEVERADPFQAVDTSAFGAKIAEVTNVASIFTPAIGAAIKS